MYKYARQGATTVIRGRWITTVKNQPKCVARRLGQGSTKSDTWVLSKHHGHIFDHVRSSFIIKLGYVMYKQIILI